MEKNNLKNHGKGQINVWIIGKYCILFTSVKISWNMHQWSIGKSYIITTPEVRFKTKFLSFYKTLFTVFMAVERPPQCCFYKVHLSHDKSRVWIHVYHVSSRHVKNHTVGKPQFIAFFDVLLQIMWYPLI